MTILPVWELVQRLVSRQLHRMSPDKQTIMLNNARGRSRNVDTSTNEQTHFTSTSTDVRLRIHSVNLYNKQRTDCEALAQLTRVMIWVTPVNIQTDTTIDQLIRKAQPAELKNQLKTKATDNQRQPTTMFTDICTYSTPFYLILLTLNTLSSTGFKSGTYESHTGLSRSVWNSAWRFSLISDRSPILGVDSPRDGRILGVNRAPYGGICFLLKHLFCITLAMLPGQWLVTTNSLSVVWCD